MNEKQQVLVSCIMPTYNRREFIPYAIGYFLRQDYKNKELIVVDDGTDNVRDLVPDIKSIRYFQLNRKASLGAKLNLACEHANGEIIANWDDDDWYASRRLSYQVDSLRTNDADVCGINDLLYYDLNNKTGYRYTYPPDQPPWLIGSSLCYTKKLWSEHHFADINVGMDGLFVWATPPQQVSVLNDPTISVHMIHNSNISPKKTDGIWWQTYPVKKLKEIIQKDWNTYSKNGFGHGKKKPVVKVNVPSPAGKGYPGKLQNINACLIHENEDVIIDLVRNLYYNDPGSITLLYNGGENAGLLKSNFPYHKFGVVIHPTPVPVKHGYLHTFALDCMEFALKNFSFDSLTIVDSDQLAIRREYSAYMKQFLDNNPGVGMLSSVPERITPEYQDNKVWPAVQAFKEFELWKPLLQQFPGGENKFVHWTFWPSTVFTSAACKDLTRLFRENALLQQIMKQTKIWATEEVILPTLVKLLGFEIISNPCSYEYVQYRKNYTAREVICALNKDDAYWIHPIERKYENPLRNQVRQHFSHYVQDNSADISPVDPHAPAELFLRTSLIDKIRKIEGWLDDKEAELLIAITLQACSEMLLPNSIVEIGSYHGKSTILFGSIIQRLFPDVKLLAIDPHDGKLGAVDQGIQPFPPSYEVFKKNIENEGLADVVEIVRDRSSAVKWHMPVSLLFIDGLHDYPSVARDFYQFSHCIPAGGYVAFHDYADYFPGVKAFVHELLKTGSYQKAALAESLVVIKKL